eukprot:XP_001706144.1 Hypothetical protein GL50803_7872 [Giardia lamblia ATCC 50803]
MQMGLRYGADLVWRPPNTTCVSKDGQDKEENRLHNRPKKHEPILNRDLASTEI